MTALKVLRGFERFSEVFRDFQNKTSSVKKVLRSAEKFSEPFPLSLSVTSLPLCKQKTLLKQHVNGEK